MCKGETNRAESDGHACYSSYMRGTPLPVSAIPAPRTRTPRVYVQVFSHMRVSIYTYVNMYAYVYVYGRSILDGAGCNGDGIGDEKVSPPGAIPTQNRVLDEIPVTVVG